MNEDVKRLIEDLRLLGPAGIERAAEAWRRAAAEDSARTAAARREEAHPAWREAEAQIFEVAGGEAWKSVEQVHREAAIGAAQDALLALLERRTLGREYRRLAAPMASALPWLLSGEAEDSY